MSLIRDYNPIPRSNSQDSPDIGIQGMHFALLMRPLTSELRVLKALSCSECTMWASSCMRVSQILSYLRKPAGHSNARTKSCEHKGAILIISAWAEHLRAVQKKASTLLLTLPRANLRPSSSTPVKRYSSPQQRSQAYFHIIAPTSQIIRAQPKGYLLACIDVDAEDAGGRDTHLALRRHLAERAHSPPMT